MRYNYRKGAKKQKGRKWLVLPVAGLLGGVYLLANTLAPAATTALQQVDETAKKLVNSQPSVNEDRVYVPKVNIDVAIVPIKGSEAVSLEKGAVHRVPQNGNPLEGGNFVIAAHRFNLGLTPLQTRAKSPFYNINKLGKGDDIYIDYKGTRYAYKVIDRKTVKPDAVEIEKRTKKSQLTMYSCELSGPKAGREVIIAEPQGTIVWENGTPRLNSL